MNPSIAERWHAEYSQKGIPSSFREEPSGSVQFFQSFLAERNIHEGKALDLGCGTGRNSVFLAENGFSVHGIDIVPGLIDNLKKQTKLLGLDGKITPICQSVTDRWPIPDGDMDVAIDTFCYKHQIDPQKRQTYRSELSRVLKPKGLYMLTLAGLDDGYYGQFLQGKDSVIIDPENQIPSVLFSKQDIESEFSDTVRVFEYHHKLKEGLMHGSRYLRSTHVFICEKVH